MDPELKDSTKSLPKAETDTKSSLEGIGEILREASQHLEPKTVETPPPLIINQETLKDLDALAERFALEVKARNVYAKLPIKNMPDQDPGFAYHGPDRELEEEDFAFNLMITYYYGYDHFKNTFASASNLLSLRKSKEHPGNMIFTMHFMQDKKQVGGRGHGTMALVSLEFSGSVTSKLIRALAQKPDLLEHLYQKCFKGLDSTDKTLGMRRAKTTGFYFIPDNKREITDKIGQRQSDKLLEFLRSLVRYNFVNGPYGSGDVLE